MSITTPPVDASAVKPAFTSISPARKIRNGLATGLVTLSFLIAMVPLIWVIVTVLIKGLAPVLNANWWLQSLNGLLARQRAAGQYIEEVKLQAAVLQATHRSGHP